MSEYYKGITFAEQNASPVDDAVIRRMLLSDGVLAGCDLSYAGYTLTMASGYLIACGRQIRHPTAENWAIADASSGYARVLMTIDMTRTSTEEVFDQVNTSIEYATSKDGFPALIQDDINATGSKYQVALAVVSLGTGGITGIVSELELAESSGGGGLNFSVVGGTTQPENPKENTIWVNTDTAITAWAFSPSEPESPAEGMAWIITGEESTAPFNALKKNGIRIYPISAKQYSAGVWNVKTAKSYTNGAWAEWWNGELFDYGNVFESVTGGYVAIEKPLVSGTNAGVPYISTNSDGSIKIQSNRTNTNGGMYYTVNKIALTDYKTLKFHGRIVDPSGYTRAGIGVWSDIGAYADTNRVVTITGNDASINTRSIDVSGLIGKYYIGFFVYHDDPYITLGKMWLE